MWVKVHRGFKSHRHRHCHESGHSSRPKPRNHEFRRFIYVSGAVERLSNNRRSHDFRHAMWPFGLKAWRASSLSCLGVREKTEFRPEAAAFDTQRTERNARKLRIEHRTIFRTHAFEDSDRKGGAISQFIRERCLEISPQLYRHCIESGRRSRPSYLSCENR